MSDADPPQPDDALVQTQAAEATGAGGLGTTAPAEPRHDVDHPGRVFDRYVIIERIGAGGMGVVFRAFDTRLERQVALKLLAKQIPSSAGLADERFVREARALAKLTHPNVVTVHDAGVAEGRRYIAMEFVDGGDLRDWVARNGEDRGRNVDAVISTLRDVGRGLAAVHAAGLVHRDVKPANVLVSRDGRVQVGDFGLVRDRNANSSQASKPSEEDSPPPRDFTATGVVMGTPAYMAPEQRMGEPIDARCDQYAYCVTFFEALTGRRPQANVQSAEFPERVDVDPAPLSEVGVPRHVRNALLRGLAWSPSERFASMDDLLRELERAPVWPRFVVVGLVGASVALAGYGLRPKEAVRSATDRECEGLSKQVAEVWSSDVREQLLAKHPEGRPIAEQLDRYANRWSAARRHACRARVDRAFSGDSSAARCLSDGLRTLKLYVDGAISGDVPKRGALQVLSDPLDCLGAGPQSAGPALAAVALANEASALRELGRRTDAIEIAKRAERDAGTDDYALASALLQQGDALGPKAADDAVPVLRRAFRFALRSGDLRIASRVASALTWATAGSSSPGDCESWSMVATELHAAGDDDAGGRLAHAIHEAQCLEATGRADERRARLEAAAREAATQRGSEHTYATLLHELSRALADEGDHDRAIERLVEARSVLRDSGLHFGDSRRRIHVGLAYLHANSGRLAQARYHLVAQLDTTQGWELPPEQRRVLMIQIAGFEAELGDPEGAERWLQRAGCRRTGAEGSACDASTEFLWVMARAGIAEVRGEGAAAAALLERGLEAAPEAEPAWKAGAEGQLEGVLAQLGRLDVEGDTLGIAGTPSALRGSTATKICWRTLAAAAQGDDALASEQIAGLGDWAPKVSGTLTGAICQAAREVVADGVVASVTREHLRTLRPRMPLLHDFIASFGPQPASDTIRRRRPDRAGKQPGGP